MLLAERLRKDDEKEVVRRVIEENIKAKIDPASMYSTTPLGEYPSALASEFAQKIVWTDGARRLAHLVGHCLRTKVSFILLSLALVLMFSFARRFVLSGGASACW